MSAALYRLGQWCFRRRRYVVVGWVLVIAVVAVVAVNVKQPTSNSITIPGTESQQALNLLDQKFPGTGGAQAQVVFSVPTSRSLTQPSVPFGSRMRRNPLSCRTTRTFSPS